MEEGPFTESHVFFPLVKKLPEWKLVVGVMYENDYRYAGIWFRRMDDANHFRRVVNRLVGWSIIGQPEALSKDSDANPWTFDAVAAVPLPKKTADYNDRFDGNVLRGALSRCREAGIEVRM